VADFQLAPDEPLLHHPPGGRAAGSRAEIGWLAIEQRGHANLAVDIAGGDDLRSDGDGDAVYDLGRGKKREQQNNQPS
jgi:hypothetical protein